MIKVTLTTAAGRKSEMFAEDQTPKDVFEYWNIDYSVTSNSINGVKLGIGDLNKPLHELGVVDECRMSAITKIDNAANIVIHGASAVLTSGVKLADWERVQKYAPDAMKIVDEEGDTVFKVMIAKGTGSANKYGVTFGASTYANKDGMATVTILLDEKCEDKQKAIADSLGGALLDLNEIEANIPEILKDIAEKEAQVAKLIVEE